MHGGARACSTRPGFAGHASPAGKGPTTGCGPTAGPRAGITCTIIIIRIYNLIYNIIIIIISHTIHECTLYNYTHLPTGLHLVFPVTLQYLETKIKIVAKSEAFFFEVPSLPSHPTF